MSSASAPLPRDAHNHAERPASGRTMPDRRSVRARVTAIEDEIQSQLSNVTPGDYCLGMRLAKQRGEMWPRELAPHVFEKVSRVFAAWTLYEEECYANPETA